ncbi:DEAD/DEAH box helicase, partial [Corynebacterium sp.]|uniref:DEAD/DEAH box helicase n=1 Tax=Corynebacterium sp. TaxID=1720 RepID=UPI0026DEB915
LRVIVHHGSDRLHGDELSATVAESDLVITSYGVVGRDFSELGELTWDRVVLDEAQAIKNSTTRASKAVRSLPSRHRVALTGTPVENRLSEMRSILDFCNPGVLGSTSFFRNHFAKAIERQHDEQMTERLRLLTAPFILRRLKTDPTIIDDLPEKNEEIITVEMTTEQAALYTALVQDVQARLEERHGMARRGLVLATITRIKQICNHPAQYLGDGSPVTVRGRHRSGKVEELMRLLDVAIATDQRMLIFTQYKAFGDILVPYLSERLGEQVPFLHGGVTKTKRDQMVGDFQSESGPRAMILSLKAGGTGLNLTAASMVVHMDRWWNPAVENQATDRAFRIGQLKDVAVYKMITAGTLEESIQDILDGKTELAGAVIGEGEGWITELGPEQLAQLMSYRGRDE